MHEEKVYFDFDIFAQVTSTGSPVAVTTSTPPGDIETYARDHAISCVRYKVPSSIYFRRVTMCARDVS